MTCLRVRETRRGQNAFILVKYCKLRTRILFQWLFLKSKRQISWNFMLSCLVSTLIQTNIEIRWMKFFRKWTMRLDMSCLWQNSKFYLTFIISYCVRLLRFLFIWNDYAFNHAGKFSQTRLDILVIRFSSRKAVVMKTTVFVLVKVIILPIW